MTIEIVYFPIKKWWCSIAMLNYQRVTIYNPYISSPWCWYMKTYMTSWVIFVVQNFWCAEIPAPAFLRGWTNPWKIPAVFWCDLIPGLQGTVTWLIPICGTRPGNLIHSYWSHGPVEIVDLSFLKMLDLSSLLCESLPGQLLGNPSWL